MSIEEIEGDSLLQERYKAEYESASIREWEEFLSSKCWRIIKRLLLAKIEGGRDRLETIDPRAPVIGSAISAAIDLLETRGGIAQLRFVIELPESILEEKLENRLEKENENA